MPVPFSDSSYPGVEFRAQSEFWCPLVKEAQKENEGEAVEKQDPERGSMAVAFISAVPRHEAFGRSLEHSLVSDW